MCAVFHNDYLDDELETFQNGVFASQKKYRQHLDKAIKLGNGPELRLQLREVDHRYRRWPYRIKALETEIVDIRKRALRSLTSAKRT